MVGISVSTIKSFTDSVAKNLFQSVSNTTQSSSQFCDLNSVIRLKAKGDIIIDGGIAVELKGFCHMKAMFDSQGTQDLKSQIDNAVSKALSQDSQQQSSVVGFLQANYGWQEQQSQTYIQSIISKQITQSVIQQSIQKAEVSSDLFIETDGSIKITGNIGVTLQAQIVSDSIAKNIFDVIQNDSLFQKGEEKDDQKNKQQEEQLSSVLFYAIIAVVIALFGIFLLPQLLGGSDENECPACPTVCGPITSSPGVKQGYSHVVY